MNARLEGFLGFIDLLAEGQRRQAESIAGRRFRYEPELQAAQGSKVIKFPLTGHQKARLYAEASKAKVPTTH